MSHTTKNVKLNARKLHVPFARAKFSRVKIFATCASGENFLTANISRSTVRAVHDCTRLKKNPILYFMPILTLLFVRLCVYYINTS